jgi:hypothetical protein
MGAETSAAVKTVVKSDRSRARNHERFFFLGMALLIFGAVFLGFAKTYYLAGVFRAPLPSWIIHIHAAAFTSWILLLIVQTLLVSAGRVDIHRRFGVCHGDLGQYGGDEFAPQGWGRSRGRC